MWTSNSHLLQVRSLIDSFPSNLNTAPAKSALRYSEQMMHAQGPRTFYGYPTMEQTKAWEKLLERQSTHKFISSGSNQYP